MPKQSNANADIQALIETFTAELELLVKRTTLEHVVSTLKTRVGASAKRGRAATGFKPAVKRGPGSRRSPEHLVKLSENLLAHVKQNPGQRGDQIAAALDTDVATMRLPMKKLIAAKQIKTAGQRRGTTYLPV